MWLVKRILPLLILELVFLILALFLLGKLVFVQKVFENAFLSSAQNPITVAIYLLKAFMSSSLLKKIIVLFLLSAGVLIMRDFGRVVVSFITTSRVAKR